jgi:small-conductance mechanosensitive channel
MPVATTVSDWGDAMMASLTGAMALFFAAIPKIIGFAIILIVGWFVASLVARAVGHILRAIHFNNLARRSGISDFVQRMGLETDASGFVAEIVKWFIRLITLVVAFDALGLPAVSDVLRQLLLWLPNLVVAIVVLVIGGIAANALASVVRASTSEAGFSNPDMLAKVARVAVWAFAIVVAVNQLGIAQTLVNTLFMAVVGAAALALGLAFGLGGRETAGEVVRRWYRRGQEAAPRIQQATETAGDMTRDMASDTTASLSPEAGNAANYGRRRGDNLAFGGSDD